MTFEETILFLKSKTIEFVYWEGKIQRSLKDSTIVGINARASSTIRLRFTVERVKKIVDENKLPVKVELRNNHLNQFRIISTE